MTLPILLFIIPIITGLLIAFAKLKEEGPPLWKKITFAGILVGCLLLLF